MEYARPLLHGRAEMNAAIGFLAGGRNAFYTTKVVANMAKLKPAMPHWWHHWECCVLCKTRNNCGNCPHAKGVTLKKQDKIAQNHKITRKYDDV